MRIRMLSAVAGGFGHFAVGETVDLHGPDAESLIARGLAVAAPPAPAAAEIERAASAAPERAEAPHPGPAGRLGKRGGR